MEVWISVSMDNESIWLSVSMDNENMAICEHGQLEVWVSERISHHSSMRFLQRGQEELLVEAVDGADVGEDAHHHLTGEGAPGPAPPPSAGSRKPGPGGAAVTRTPSPCATAR